MWTGKLLSVADMRNGEYVLRLLASYLDTERSSLDVAHGMDLNLVVEKKVRRAVKFLEIRKYPEPHMLLSEKHPSEITSGTSKYFFLNRQEVKDALAFGRRD